MSPVAAILLLRVVNLQSQPVSISLISLEMRGHGWAQLKRVPTKGITPYFDPMNNARNVSIRPDDIFDLLISKGKIGASETLEGTMLALLAAGGPSLRRWILQGWVLGPYFPLSFDALATGR